MKKRVAIIGALVSLFPMGQPVLLGTLAVSTSTILLSAPNANAGVKEDILSNIDRAYESSSAGNHKDAIRSATKVLKLLPKMGMEDSEFAYYMYSVRGWSKYEINDIRGACADWRKEVSLSKELGDGFEADDTVELIRDEC